MDATRWERLEEIFNNALVLGSVERGCYLAEACSHDPGLLKEVESLISSYESDQTFLQQPALEMGLKILATNPTQIALGDSIGPYQIVSILGRGGMGTVFLALDPRLGRKVALKILVSTITEDTDSRRRFRLEARVASKISHPNVASIYEVGEFKQHQFIAMEFVDGVTLRQRLSHGPLPINETLDIIIQTGRAIEAAHTVGVIHRDIKPENIIIRSDGYVKVLDFGLAKLAPANGEEVTPWGDTATNPKTTAPGLLMGTMNYMSPEQLRGQKVDTRTDIWSWGIVLYEMIEGQAPFHGPSGSDVVAEILKAEPALLSNRSTLPASLCEVLRKSLQKEREERYSEITQALADLRKLQKRLESEEDAAEISGSQFQSEPARGFSTARHTAAESDPIRTPPITDAHVLADNFPTIGEKQAYVTSQQTVAADLRKYRVAIVTLVLMAAVIVAGLLYRFRMHTTPARNPQFTKLFIPGSIKESVISPDGRFVATITDTGGKHAISLRQLSTANDLQLVSSSKDRYRGMSFSPDGDYLYYLKEEGNTAALFRVSALGGSPTQVLDIVDTPVTFSPDGRRLAFIRTDDNGGPDQLVTATVDGREQKILTSSQLPDHFQGSSYFSSGPAWSPDGQVIACITYRVDRPTVDLVTVGVEDGLATRVGTQTWLLIERMAWLSDGTGLLIQAQDQAKSPYQLWLVSYPSGKAESITHDPNRYIGLSATRDSSTLLATTSNQVSSVWIIGSGQTAATMVPLSEYRWWSIAWTPDGKLVYSSKEDRHFSIWIMNVDGSERKQLTFNEHDMQPVVSPDGKYIVFTRGNERDLWRMRLDGSDQKQLGNNTKGDSLRFTPDGAWIVYSNTGTAGAAAIRRISINGGESQDLIYGTAGNLDVSPDGKWIACFARGPQVTSPWRLEVFSANGVPQKGFDIPPGTVPQSELSWTPTGDALTYVVTSEGVSNIWSQPISGASRRQLTDFQEGRIPRFGRSSDGRLAIVRVADKTDLFLLKDFR